MKDFKKFGGPYIEDLGEYVRNYLKEHAGQDMRIYVGCDSENSKNKTRYATVVMLYHNGSGAHFIFRLEAVPRVKEMFVKLWGEVERTFAVAEYLEAELDGVFPRLNQNEKLVDVDLDLNSNPKWKSNIAYDAGVGFMKSNGYRVRTKPKAWAASAAADLIVRKRNRKKKGFF